MLPGLLQVLCLLLSVPPTRASPLSRRANNITVELGQITGSGCPLGTVSASFSADRTVLTFGFDEFDTYLGPGYSPRDRTKDCTIPVKLRYPLGSSFEVVDAVYHGFAPRLDVGMTARMQSTYTIIDDGGGSKIVNTTAEVVGPLPGIYTKTAPVSDRSMLRSGCGRDTVRFDINTRVATWSSIALPSGSIDNGPVFSLGTHQVRLNWAAC